MNGFVNMNPTKEEGSNEDCLKLLLVVLLMLISMVLLTSLEKSEKESFDVTMLPKGRGFWWNPVRISV